MKSFEDINKLRNTINSERFSGNTIGFVPTMGALHEGHISLLKKSKKENDITVCSIYVNPTQFDNPDDLSNYPKTINDDKKKLEQVGCDILFLPTDKTMYPSGTKKLFLKMSFGSLESEMEGKHRDGHFNGVGIVVSKLFNIVSPDKAYFGQKDLQQYSIIKNMGEALSFNIDIISCPIVREKDGLAMSSRNTRLTTEERQISPLLYKALSRVKNLITDKTPINKALEEGKLLITNEKTFSLEYLEVVNVSTLKPLNSIDESHGEIAICLAAHIGNVRLIDNIVFEI